MIIIIIMLIINNFYNNALYITFHGETRKLKLNLIYTILRTVHFSSKLDVTRRFQFSKHAFAWFILVAAPIGDLRGRHICLYNNMHKFSASMPIRTIFSCSQERIHPVKQDYRFHEWISYFSRIVRKLYNTVGSNAHASTYDYKMNWSNRNGLDSRLRFSLSANRCVDPTV